MEVKVFNKGQVVIPAFLRKKYNINIGEKVKIIEEKDGIKIIPARNPKSILEFAGIFSKKGSGKQYSEIEKITEKEFIESFKNEIYWYKCNIEIFNRR